MFDVPSSWSLRDASTVPTAYMTAYYALVMRGGLKSHHSVLIHSGAGAVGLASIRICHHRGCEVCMSPYTARTLMYLLCLRLMSPLAHVLM